MNEDMHGRHGRDPDEIERDIARTRTSLGHTIEELENRLSPGELLDQVVGAARRHGGDFATNLGRSAENHPMPLLLTAVGIAWMMASANRPPPPARPRGEHADLSSRAAGAKHRMQHGVDSAKSAASAVGDRASRASHAVGDRVGAVGDSVGHAGERIREQSRRMKAGFSHMLEDQPLLLEVAKELKEAWARRPSDIIVSAASRDIIDRRVAEGSFDTRLTFMTHSQTSDEVASRNLFALDKKSSPRAGRIPPPEEAARQLHLGLVGEFEPLGAVGGETVDFVSRGRLRLEQAKWLG